MVAPPSSRRGRLALLRASELRQALPRLDELGQVGIGVAPEALDLCQLARRRRAIAPAFYREGQRVVRAGVSGIVLEHLTRQKLRELEIAGFAGRPSHSLQTEERLDPGVGPVDGARPPGDFFEQWPRRGPPAVAQQDLGPQA